MAHYSKLSASTVFVSVLMTLAPSVILGADNDAQPLNRMTFNFNGAASTRPWKYDWRAVGHSGATIQSHEYGTIVVSTAMEKGNMVLHDEFTVAPQDLAGAPKDLRWLFDRTIISSVEKPLVPRVITIDMSDHSPVVHQFNFKDGIATYIDESGRNGTTPLDFSHGILTFDALLRIAPLLPRTLGGAYTFTEYAEPLLFRTHTSDESDPVFAVRCESLETIAIGQHSCECCKFSMDLKSAVIKTTLWVDRSRNVVVKFTDDLPAGSDADRMEAALVE